MPQLAERVENLGVLTYLGSGAEPRDVPVVRPGPDTDTWRLGAHPDVVQHLWERLNASLPADSRCLVADTATLVDPRSGMILAVALGTQYALRLTGEGLVAAQEAGHEQRHEFATVDRTLDLAATFGPGWVFGRYDAREPEWLQESGGAVTGA